jgi:2-dehydropantoate 2-reductase
MEQVLVVGAGSVGGFFGAHLAQHYQGRIAFLLRPRTLEAVRRHGLIIRSANGTLTVHPQAASTPGELPKPDLIVLAMKAYDLEEVLEQIATLVTPQTMFLTLQNGVDIEERIATRYDRRNIIGGVAYIYSKIVEPGVIDHYKRGSLAIGELSGAAPGGASARIVRIADLFKQAGIPCQVSDDIHRTKWEKMCWNCVFNPLTVVIDDRVSAALDHPEMLHTIQQIVKEVAAVSEGLKVPLPSDMADRVLKWTQEIRDIHTSMYDDWKAGRPTEIDALNGYIVQRGKELGIATPVNEALTGLIKAITAKDPSDPDTVRIDGAVVQPLVLNRTALAKLPVEHQIIDVGSVQPGMKGQGIRMKGLLEIPALAIGADHVTFHSRDGRYAAGLTLAQAKQYGVLIYQRDGQPLADDQGGPYRLITPGLGDLCANVKGVCRIEICCAPGKDTRTTTCMPPS